MNPDDSGDDQGVVMKTSSSSSKNNPEDHPPHPQQRKNSHHHHHHHHHDINPLNPSDQQDEEIAVFSELSHLCQSKDGPAWREIARWVKYEENVEANGSRWSKPYVSTVNVAAFQELRDSFRNGVVIFDSQSESLNQLVDEFCRILRTKNMVTAEESKHIANLLSLQKLHLFQTKRSLMRSLADMRQQSSNNFLKLISGSNTKINQAVQINENEINSNSRSDSEENVSNNNSKNGSIANLQNFNDAFMRKLPDNVVSNNILIAEVDFLQSPISGFIRLQTATVLGNMTEVSIPTKFIYIYLGPKMNSTTGLNNYEQIGRALGTLMSDLIFRQVAFKTQNISALIQALDDFLNESPILPPNLWDPSTRIEPPEKTPAILNKNRGRQMLHESTLLHRESCQFPMNNNSGSNDGSISDGGNSVNGGGNGVNNNDQSFTSQSYYNKAFFLDNGDKVISFRQHDTFGCLIDDKINMDSDDEEEIERKQMGLVRSGRWFGGLINDVKRKIPHYKSDFIDALSMQSIASIVFLYFACLTPIITFGGLLGDATGNNIATMESLVCGCLCGIVYGLFSGQPLTILGSTGPVLVFETIVYDFCRTYGYDYLPLRLWIGLWTATILMIFVAFDLSYFVCYITRFTEENFASLISVIFMYKAIEKLLKINRDFPIHLHPLDDPNNDNNECLCLLNNHLNITMDMIDQQNHTITIDGDNGLRNRCLHLGGILYGSGCHNKYTPDVFLFSFILLIFTYIISIKLKSFQTTRFFTTNIRQMFSDFSVPIAIVIMTAIDNLTGLPTPKLQVPNDFKPTLPTRTWLVSPFAEANPTWLPFAAFIPATLATILIFMDQQITAVIVNRKENKLKKGCGYHLDLFILSILICICSIFGLPWFVAATVLSITHVNSLKMVSQTAAPGDRPKFLGVREQRVTQIGIFLLCGLSIFFTPVLQRIPMAVLYGVFFYMGVTSLQGSQFMDRIAIMFMPQKYQPDYMFLRRVKMYRVHMFTIIQVICFIFLWVIKSSKPISITFPLMLVVILGIRKLLDYVFTQEELKILDDKMPESKRKKKERTKERLSVMIMKNKQQQQQNGRPIMDNSKKAI
ncbi:Sodium bicarbonate cotransporter 3 [Dermatophagoides pteronyssinus]|uniref:Anion exchange protein n=1 Tax=Dermatophagoides pteronyssinus TaxID=6956 RepID=A0ABQ8JTR7_DERPT|nr:Sodium bicarbonate cotransporter 3 [Dermatophagoides pteronyssinus]